MDELEGVHFYYIRDERDNKPVVTVAIADTLNNGIICRGVAICSEDDRPVKSRGRNIALGRLKKAFVNEENSEPIKSWYARTWKVKAYIDGYMDYTFGFKSGYDVEATEFELGLLDPDFQC